MCFVLFDVPSLMVVDMAALLNVSVYPDVGACLNCFLDEVADVEALLCCCANRVQF